MPETVTVLVSDLKHLLETIDDLRFKLAQKQEALKVKQVISREEYGDQVRQIHSVFHTPEGVIVSII